MHLFCNKLTSKLLTFIPAFLIWFIKSTGLSKKKASDIIVLLLIGYLLYSQDYYSVVTKETACTFT